MALSKARTRCLPALFLRNTTANIVVTLVLHLFGTQQPGHYREVTCLYITVLLLIFLGWFIVMYYNSIILIRGILSDHMHDHNPQWVTVVSCACHS